VDTLDRTRGPRVNMTPAHLRNLIPDVPGCSLTEYLTLQRYQGFYPGAIPRGSCCRSWAGRGASATRTKEQALDEVVQWLWWAHKRFGEKAPAAPTSGTQPPPSKAARAASAAPVARGGQRRRGRAAATSAAEQPKRGRQKRGTAAAAAPEPDHAEQPSRKRLRAAQSSGRTRSRA
jgi:hypothetical protein